MLVVDNRRDAELLGAVVVIGREFAQIRLYRGVVDPPVEIEYRGLIFINELTAAYEPVFEIIGGGNGFAEGVVHIFDRHGRPVEIAFFFCIGDIALELTARTHEEPVLHAVGGAACEQALFARRLVQFTEHVPVRSHLDRVPVRDLGCVHLEAVMMLGNGDHVLETSLFEQIRPFVGVELLRPEHRDKVFVAEILLRAEGLYVMLKFARALHVHAP